MARFTHAELLCLIGAGAVGAGVHSAIETLGVLAALHIHRPRLRLSPALSPGGTR
jgi:hypothetical protein